MTAGQTRQQLMAERRRSGSQKRARKRNWQIALTDDEYAAGLAKAEAAGLSQSSYGRAALLGDVGIRARRSPSVNAVLLAQAIAALNKAGSNLNQITRHLNAGKAAGSTEALHTLSQTRTAVEQIIALTGRDRAA